MRKWLPENVTEWKDRHGKKRYRFRKKGLPDYHFKHAPGSPEFLGELYAAKNAEKPPVERFAPFSYDTLAVSFYDTVAWIEMADSSQATYRNIIERFRAKNGTKDARKVTAANIAKRIAGMADTPAAANNLRKTLSRLHKHAVLLGWRTDNPVEVTQGFKKKGEGFHCWTDEELAAFDAKWPIGTRERLAKELLLGTALRKSDVLTVGKANRKGDRLILNHGKNDSDTNIKMSAAMIAAINACPSKGPTYIETQFGKPFSPTGFYNWFKRGCVKAGIPNCSPHGLRKAISRLIAESGKTVMEGRAVTGHKTDKEFLRYAEQANKAKMADSAMANLENWFAIEAPETEEKDK